MMIRPIIPQDKEKLFRLLTHRGIFKEKEIEVAMEVIEDSLFAGAPTGSEVQGSGSFFFAQESISAEFFPASAP
jgi:hypothetical protein